MDTVPETFRPSCLRPRNDSLFNTPSTAQVQPISIHQTWSSSQWKIHPISRTWCVPKRTRPGGFNSVLTALKLDYRHIDTTSAYDNESDLDKATRDSGIPRKEIFDTSKYYEMSWTRSRPLPRSRGTTRKPLMTFEKATANKVSKYINHYLLHDPCDSATVADAWKALGDMQLEELVRVIGVCQIFGEKHLLKLFKTRRAGQTGREPSVSAPLVGPLDTVMFCESQESLM